MDAVGRISSGEFDFRRHRQVRCPFPGWCAHSSPGRIRPVATSRQDRDIQASLGRQGSGKSKNQRLGSISSSASDVCPLPKLAAVFGDCDDAIHHQHVLASGSFALPSSQLIHLGRRRDSSSRLYRFCINLVASERQTFPSTASAPERTAESERRAYLHCTVL